MTGLQKKKHYLGFWGLYSFLVQPIINACMHFEIVSTGSPEAFLPFLRYLRYIVRADSYCSVCGQKVREHWKSVLPYVVDPLGIEENLKPFDRARVGCISCDPFFQGFHEEGEIFYIV